MLGTPSYMSPEQIRGKSREIGPATDIYSLGVVMYRLLTGRRPFEGSLTAIVAAISTESPAAPRNLCGTISPAMEAVCLKAMAKSPSDRFRSAAEMASALDQAFQTPLIAASEKGADFNDVKTQPLSKPVASVTLAQEIVVGTRKSTNGVRAIGCVVTISLAVMMLIAAWPGRGWSPISGPGDTTLQTTAVPPAAMNDPTKINTAKDGDSTEFSVATKKDSSAVGSNAAAPETQNGKRLSANPILETHLQRADVQIGFEVLSQKSLPLRARDKLQFHVKLNAPNYVYLYLIDTTGMPTRLWPETAGDLEQQKPVTELWAPPLADEGQKQKMYFLDDLHGQETVMVATSLRPLSQADLQSVESVRLNLTQAEGDKSKLLSFRREERERGIGGIVETDKALPVEIDKFTERLSKVFDGYTGIVFPHE